MFMRLLLGCTLLSLSLSTNAAELVPVDVAGFFVRPDEPAILRWKVATGESSGTIDYTIRDYRGESVSSGVLKPADDGPMETAVTLSAGFYEIGFPANSQRFGIAALPAYRGRTDPFFAIDSALSWLVRGDDVRRGLIEILRRSGIGMSRERLNWGNIRPTDNQWAWDGDRRYDTLRNDYREAGVELLEMFHDTPGWIGKVGKYPEDLVATARLWKEIGKRWRPTWGAIEIWNEPDISFGDNLPADQYVPLVETIAHAFDEAGVDLPIVGGVFAHYSQPYLDTAAAGGFLDSIDVASFHTYGRAPQMESLVQKYRSWLAANHRATMPLWITECGRPWGRGTDRPSVEEDAVSALDITMKAVEARACGIERHFPFVYPFYEERNSNFGMMCRRATPLRSMAAYAQLVRRLAHKEYLGDLKTEPDGLQRARVFGDGRETIVVLYTGEVDARGSVALGMPIIQVEGIDGRELTVDEAHRVPIPDGLGYVWLDGAKLGDRLLTDTPAMRLWQVAAGVAPKRPAASPILMRLDLNPELMSAETPGYRIRPEVVSRVPLDVKVFNLDSRAHEVELTLGAKVSLVDGVRTRMVEIPAEGVVEVGWLVDLGPAFAKSDLASVRIAATSAEVPRISPLEARFFGGANLEEIVARFERQVRLPVGDLARWTPHAGAQGKVEMASTDEVVWRMDVSFGEGDAWAYPRFELPPEVDLARFEALVLRVRCDGPAAVRVFLWEGDGGVGYLAGTPIVPADGQWYSAVVRFGDLSASGANTPDENGRLDLEQVRRISVGFNSEAQRNGLEVSDVYVVGW